MQKQSTAPLYIYMVDHGANGSFKISSKDIDGDGSKEIVYASELKKAIDDFVSKKNREVIVIIEACNSGSFIPTLTDNTHGKTSVVTSSKAGENSIIDGFGSVSYTHLLFEELLAGNSFASSVSSSIDTLPTMGEQYKMQTPQYSLSKAIEQECVNSCFVTASMNLSSIDSIKIDGSELKNDIIDLTNKKKINIDVKLNASDVIKRVWAVVLTPDYTPPQIGEFESPNLDNYTQELFYNDSSDSYKGDYIIPTIKTYDGNYSISVYAEDRNGYIATLSDVYKGNGETEVIVDIENSITLNSGWNLTALPTTDINNHKLIWGYNNSKWEITSNDNVIQNAIDKTSLNKLTSIDKNRGYWILNDNNISLDFGTQTTTSLQTRINNLDKGWHILSSYNNLYNINSLIGYNTIWSYKNGNWSAYSLNSEILDKLYNSSTLNILDNITKFSGIWINK